MPISTSVCVAPCGHRPWSCLPPALLRGDVVERCGNDATKTSPVAVGLALAWDQPAVRGAGRGPYVQVGTLAPLIFNFEAAFVRRASCRGAAGSVRGQEEPFLRSSK